MDADGEFQLLSTSPQGNPSTIANWLHQEFDAERSRASVEVGITIEPARALE